MTIHPDVHKGLVAMLDREQAAWPIATPTLQPVTLKGVDTPEIVVLGRVLRVLAEIGIAFDATPEGMRSLTAPGNPYGSSTLISFWTRWEGDLVASLHLVSAHGGCGVNLLHKVFSIAPAKSGYVYAHNASVLPRDLVAAVGAHKQVGLTLLPKWQAPVYIRCPDGKLTRLDEPYQKARRRRAA